MGCFFFKRRAALGPSMSSYFGVRIFCQLKLLAMTSDSGKYIIAR